MFRHWLLLLIPLVALTGLTSPDSGHNGKRFDPGFSMTGKAEKAPDELDQAAFLLGQYDVTWTFHNEDGTTRNAAAQARFDYMNRGWLYNETFSCKDFDGKGTSLHTLAFLTYAPGAKTWGIGVANSHTERIELANGSFENGKLVLRDARRRNGGMVLTHERQTFAPSSSGFTWLLERSHDGATWKKVQERVYKKRPAKADFLKGTAIGSPSADRPGEAAGFDFLIGEGQANHDMTFPNGRRSQWPANATAVYVLGGKGILEFNWFDLDPTLPDAATSIIRLYNRAERRWESLFTTNRSNSLLYFGGVQEKDRIVLHGFDTDRTGTVSHWVFHDIGKDTYKWFGENSTDGGQTYKTFWTIGFQRKKAPQGKGSE